jgi:alkylation response protein AidB-like acyl-CoA dehydrogenase
MESKMQLVLTEDQDLLAKTAADWVAEKSPVARVRALRDSNDPDGFSRTLWKEMAELGWVGIPFSEEQGGAEMGVSELAVVLEALGRTLAPEPFIGNVMLAGSVLQRAGSEAQQKEWLPRLCEGESILALAQQERGSRFDLHRVATRAARAGEGYRLEGEKVAVLDGASADALVVVARTSGDEADREGISLFLVPAGTPGVRVTRQVRVDARNAALVHLDAEVPGDALLGSEGAGLAPLEAAADAATVALTSEMLGSMSEAFERTLGYLRDRQQFGVPIGSFQALKHRAADMFTEIELCRSSVMAAARAVDEGLPDAPSLVSLAKARCSETGILVANEAIQMHGGIGMTDEHEIGFYLKRARVAELTLGDASWHRDRWARLSEY